MAQIFYRDPDTKVFRELDPEKLWAELIIAGVPHEEVSYRNADGSLQGTIELDDNGQGIIEVEIYDTYIVNEEHTIVVDVAKQYHISLIEAWTVIIDLDNANPKEALTYTHKATGHETGWDAWKNEPFFNAIKPCAFENGQFVTYLDPDDYTKAEDGTLVDDWYEAPQITTSTTTGSIHDIMVEFPKFGYKIEKDIKNNNVYVSITTQDNAPGFCYFAHSLEQPGDCDKIYIGAYMAQYVPRSSNLLCSSPSGTSYYSASTGQNISDIGRTLGASPSVLRKAANDRGEGYQLMSFYVWTLLQCLYLIIFKQFDNYNTAASEGGFSDSRDLAYLRSSSPGKMDKDGIFSFQHEGRAQIKCFGLEYLWGEWYTICDGVFIDFKNNIMYTDYKNFDQMPSISACSLTELLTNNRVYITNLSGTNESGFMIEMPQLYEGSTSTYMGACCEYDMDNTINSLQYFQYLVGSKCSDALNTNWRSGRPASLFEIVLYQHNDVAQQTCARLVYKHKAI